MSIGFFPIFRTYIYDARVYYTGLPLRYDCCMWFQLPYKYMAISAQTILCIEEQLNVLNRFQRYIVYGWFITEEHIWCPESLQSPQHRQNNATIYFVIKFPIPFSSVYDCGLGMWMWTQGISLQMRTFNHNEVFCCCKVRIIFTFRKESELLLFQ